MVNKTIHTNMLNIMYTNIRSMKTNYNSLLLTLASRLEDKTKPDYDIIALTETWISKDQLHLYPLDGYRSFIESRAKGRRSGGVIIYVKEGSQILETSSINLPGANVLKLKMKVNSYEKCKLVNDITLFLIYIETVPHQK